MGSEMCIRDRDVTEKKQMYRRELIGMEEKVKETAEQIEELLKSMRELGV